MINVKQQFFNQYHSAGREKAPPGAAAVRLSPFDKCGGWRYNYLQWASKPRDHKRRTPSESNFPPYNKTGSVCLHVLAGMGHTARLPACSYGQVLNIPAFFCASKREKREQKNKP
jgi:hypothetical protein